MDGITNVLWCFDIYRIYCVFHKAFQGLLCDIEREDKPNGIDDLHDVGWIPNCSCWTEFCTGAGMVVAVLGIVHCWTALNFPVSTNRRVISIFVGGKCNEYQTHDWCDSILFDSDQTSQQESIFRGVKLERYSEMLAQE